jgi:hypothetical protein
VPAGLVLLAAKVAPLLPRRCAAALAPLLLLLLAPAAGRHRSPDTQGAPLGPLAACRLQGGGCGAVQLKGASGAQVAVGHMGRQAAIGRKSFANAGWRQGRDPFTETAWTAFYSSMQRDGSLEWRLRASNALYRPPGTHQQHPHPHIPPAAAAADQLLALRALPSAPDCPSGP